MTTATAHDDRAQGIVEDRHDRPLTAEIAAVFPDAVKVEARELKLGDCLFDTFGGTHEIVEIERRKNSRWIQTTRLDGWVDHFERHDTVTILRGGS